MLKLFFELKEGVKIFMDIKGVPIIELEDKKFQSDLAFLVDITSHLNNLNLKLQSSNQLITSLLFHIKSLQLMLHSFVTQLKRKCFKHFPKLSEQHPESTKEYSDEYESFLKKFEIRFEELQDKIELRVLKTPFDMCPEEDPDS
ncbi:general transcription factor II-I repeat domain-containing protein 2-like [Octopus sinensis]|uniref:General transcription factor II-I repeat domain-containing protein 2-like n=1 Tax=Octopus sinensis TaxID=2607531 RepID=A0A6P7SSR5_9MOLL|nr:general transcription factor II-I repeat domain-containing protein 2-like [Octopus sinensis]